jgi:RNA polymerase sigma-70 factor (ECF subfamily)
MPQFELARAETEQTGNGGRGSFWEQLIALLPRLSVFALCLTGNSGQRDDLVRETCARALAHKEQWQPGAHLDAWMFRIAHNLWFDRMRAKGFRSESRDIDYPVGSDARAITASGLVLGDLLTALDRLSPEHRVMIALVCVDGLTYSKAAEILSLPVGTVMSRLAHGRLALYDAVNAAAASKATRH